MGVTFDFIPANAAAPGVFVEQKAVRGGLGGLLIPQKILIIGQYNSGKTPEDNVPKLLTGGANQAADLYGLGSMLHIMAMAVDKGRGIVPLYALPVADAGGAQAADGQITVTGTAGSSGTISLYIAGKLVRVAVAKDDTYDVIAEAIADAINADVTLPVTAAADSGDVNLTAKWKGLTGNDITIEVDLGGDTEAANEPEDVTLTITDMDNGATDPAITTALAALGDTWYTIIVNPYTADAQLDDLEEAGDARINPLVKRPFIGLCGYVDTLANLLTFLDDRNSAWTSPMPVEGSPNLPAEIAAALAGKAAAHWQSKPGVPYRGVLPDILPGTVRWTYAQRDQVIKAGASTFRVGADNRVYVDALATTRTQNDLGADDDSWRWTETINNIQAKIYSVEQLFLGEPFVEGIVVEDDAITGASYAIRPKTVKAYAIKLIDELWAARALTKERDAVVAGIVAEIDDANPGRINLLIPDVMAAGLKIIAGKIEWSFYAPVGA